LVDLRAYNALWPTPPYFDLPSLDQLLTSRGATPLFFTKLDLRNCYWSILLPRSVHGSFSISCAEATYSTRRLPFGWTWSPALAQLLIGRLLEPLVRGDVLCFQYLDDLLFVSPDPSWLQQVTYHAMGLLEQTGVLISPKSVPHPVHSITWLGKRISSAPLLLENTDERVASLLLHAFFARYQCLSRRHLQQLLGRVQWANFPAKHATIYLNQAYALLPLIRRQMRLPSAVWNSLLLAVVTALIPCASVPAVRAPWLPQVTIDAAPCGSRFQVAATKAHSFSTVTTSPRWVQTINQAELYGAFHALRQLGLRRFTCANLITDSSFVFHTLRTWRGSASNPCAVRILRRIWRVCVRFRVQFTVSLIASRHNPADFFSRMSSRDALAAFHETSPICILSHLKHDALPHPPFRWLKHLFPCCVD
jgi:hypothetical protein